MTAVRTALSSRGAPFCNLPPQLAGALANERSPGIKEYSDWPTIPQLYVDNEFIGGCDILMSMHQDGSLAKMLEEKGVLVPTEEGGNETPK
jgi:monothiol glutaredoxin